MANHWTSAHPASKEHRLRCPFSRETFFVEPMPKPLPWTDISLQGYGFRTPDYLEPKEDDDNDNDEGVTRQYGINRLQPWYTAVLLLLRPHVLVYRYR